MKSYAHMRKCVVNLIPYICRYLSIPLICDLHVTKLDSALDRFNFRYITPLTCQVVRTKETKEIVNFRTWRDASAGKSPCCSQRGSGFDFQYPHQEAHRWLRLQLQGI